MSLLIGYARVSTLEQDLNLQVDALLKAACQKNLIFKDKVSGSKTDRPGLTQCLDNLVRGKKGGSPKVDTSKIQAAKRMYQDKALAIADICKVLNISKPTLYRYLAN